MDLLRDLQDGACQGHGVPVLAPECIELYDLIVKAIIPEFIESCLKEIPWERYDIIGFTSVFNQNVASLALAKKLKERFPGKPIVFGGQNVSGPMGIEMLKAFEWVDYVVDGEGEVIFPALVKNILEGKPYHPIPGVHYRKGSEVVVSRESRPYVDLDNESPPPCYDDFFEQFRRYGFDKYGLLPQILFETSRGCWWGQKQHCTFCGLLDKEMSYRAKSPRRALKDIVELVRKYKAFKLTNVDLIMDMRYFKTMLPFLKRKGLDISLYYETKANLTKDQVRILCDAGVDRVAPGIENFSTPVLRLMRKGTTGIQNIELLKWFRERDLWVGWNLLYGFPGETMEDYRHNLDTVLLLGHLHPPQGYAAVRLDRYSPNFTQSERFGFSDVVPMPLYRYIYPKRVELPNIAYFFHGRVKQGLLPSDPPIKQIEDACEKWKANSRKMFLAVLRGSGYLHILDHRLLPGSKPKVELAGLFRLIYLFCEHRRSLQGVVDFVEEKRPGRYGVGQVESVLHKLVAARLMYGEDGQYLSLAVPFRVYENDPSLKKDIDRCLMAQCLKLDDTVLTALVP